MIIKKSTQLTNTGKYCDSVVFTDIMSCVIYCFLLSIPVVVSGGGGGGVVVGGFPFLMQRILHFPPSERFLASVTTLMLKSSLTLSASYFPFLLQSLRNNMFHKI